MRKNALLVENIVQLCAKERHRVVSTILLTGSQRKLFNVAPLRGTGPNSLVRNSLVRHHVVSIDYPFQTLWSSLFRPTTETP